MTVVAQGQARGKSPAEPLVAWRLDLLGTWRLSRAGQVVAMRHRERRLLAYLALHGPMPRVAVAGALWPETTDARAQGSLRVTVCHIRQCASGVLSPTDHSVGLSRGVGGDVHDLLRASDLEGGGSADDLQDALAVPTAPLLPGWYDDWVRDDREWLENLRLLMLFSAAQRHLARGQWDLALATAVHAARMNHSSPAAVRLISQVTTAFESLAWPKAAPAAR